MKHQIQTHFWFPNLHDAVRTKVASCKPCQLYTNKTTKEPQSILKGPSSAWDTVALDLFGPIPTGKHVLVVQDVLTRYPAAKIVPSTSSSKVLPALNDIYINYGYLTTHLRDNGPPFNSTEFTTFSKNSDIHHQTTYLYYPQANPAEHIIEPLGKALKAAHFNGQSSEEALNDFLVGFRATPHVATGVPPADFLFWDGYRANFPYQHPLSYRQVERAKMQDIEHHQNINTNANKSIKRKQDQYKQNNFVLVKNFTRTKKFEPKYLPIPFCVISLNNTSVSIQCTADDVLFYHHKDDMKHCTKIPPPINSSHYPKLVELTTPHTSNSIFTPTNIPTPAAVPVLPNPGSTSVRLPQQASDYNLCPRK